MTWIHVKKKAAGINDPGCLFLFTILYSYRKASTGCNPAAREAG